MHLDLQEVRFMTKTLCRLRTVVMSRAITHAPAQKLQHVRRNHLRVPGAAIRQRGYQSANRQWFSAGLTPTCGTVTRMKYASARRKKKCASLPFTEVEDRRGQ